MSNAGYNLEIKSNRNGLSPREVKNTIREVFCTVIKNTPYNDPEDSTSVLTIKMIDRKRSRIKYSFDLAIVEERENGLAFVQRNPY